MQNLDLALSKIKKLPKDKRVKYLAEIKEKLRDQKATDSTSKMVKSVMDFTDIFNTLLAEPIELHEKDRAKWDDIHGEFLKDDDLKPYLAQVEENSDYKLKKAIGEVKNRLEGEEEKNTENTNIISEIKVQLAEQKESLPLTQYQEDQQKLRKSIESISAKIGLQTDAARSLKKHVEKLIGDLESDISDRFVGYARLTQLEYVDIEAGQGIDIEKKIVGNRTHYKISNKVRQPMIMVSGSGNSGGGGGGTWGSITGTITDQTDLITYLSSYLTSITPGGSDTQIQFNDDGSLGGDAGLTYNKTNDTVTIAGAGNTLRLNLSKGNGESLRITNTNSTGGAAMALSSYGSASGIDTVLGANLFFNSVGSLDRHDTSKVGWGFELRSGDDFFAVRRLSAAGVQSDPFTIKNDGSILAGIGGGVYPDAAGFGPVFDFRGLLPALSLSSTTSGGIKWIIASDVSGGNGFLDIYDETNSVRRGIIDKDGNWMIGSSVSPAGRLHVKGSADDQQLIVQNNGTQNANPIELWNSGGTAISYFIAAGGVRIPTAQTLADTGGNGSIRFESNAAYIEGYSNIIFTNSGAQVGSIAAQRTSFGGGGVVNTLGTSSFDYAQYFSNSSSIPSYLGGVYGTSFEPAMSATANNDIMVGVRFLPRHTPGVFTGLTQIATMFETPNANSITAVFKGASAQTTSLTEWRTYTSGLGTTVASVSSAGVITTPQLIALHATTPYIDLTRNDSDVRVNEFLGGFRWVSVDPQSTGLPGASIEAYASQDWSIANRPATTIKIKTVGTLTDTLEDRLVIANDGDFKFYQSTSSASSVGEVSLYRRTTAASPTNSFGQSLKFYGDGDGADDLAMGRIRYTWFAPTSPTQQSRLVFSVYNGSTEIDALSFTASGNSVFAPAANTSLVASPVAFTLNAPANIDIDKTDTPDVLWNLARTVDFKDGGASTVTNQRAFKILAPTYASGAGLTLTNAATFYIDAAPVAGTNVTLTNAYALWIDSGVLRLDGNLDLSNAGGANIITDTTTGTKIGTSATQKIGQWGATPVVQNTGWSVTNYTTKKTLDANSATIDDILDFLGTLTEEAFKVYGTLGA